MLRDALYIARMDAGYLLSRRETVIWTFVMPIVFFYFIGSILGSGGASNPADPTRCRGPRTRRARPRI